MTDVTNFENNAILACLKDYDRAAALRCGEVVHFRVRDNVYRPEEHIEDAYPSDARVGS